MHPHAMHTPKSEARNPKSETNSNDQIQMTKTGNRKRVPHNLPSQTRSSRPPSQTRSPRLPSRSDDLCQPRALALGTYARCRARALGFDPTQTPAVAHGGIHATGPWPRPQPTRGMTRTTPCPVHPCLVGRDRVPSILPLDGTVSRPSVPCRTDRVPSIQESVPRELPTGPTSPARCPRPATQTPKSEARNPKQIQMSQIQMFKTPVANCRQQRPMLCRFLQDGTKDPHQFLPRFDHSHLFRISCLGFRI